MVSYKTNTHTHTKGFAERDMEICKKNRRTVYRCRAKRNSKKKKRKSKSSKSKKTGSNENSHEDLEGFLSNFAKTKQDSEQVATAGSPVNPTNPEVRALPEGTGASSHPQSVSPSPVSTLA